MSLHSLPWLGLRGQEERDCSKGPVVPARMNSSEVGTSCQQEGLPEDLGVPAQSERQAASGLDLLQNLLDKVNLVYPCLSFLMQYLNSGLLWNVNFLFTFQPKGR